MSQSLFRLRYVAGALMALGMLVLAACGGSSAGTTSGTSSVSGTGSNPQAQMIAQKVQQENLKGANVNLQAALTSQSLGTVRTVNSGKMTLNPFALQVKTVATTAGTSSSTATATSNSFTGEEIFINQRAYVRQSGETQWREASLPANTNQSVPFISLQNLAKTQNLQMENNGQPETVTINGQQIKAYHLRATGTQTVNGQSANYTEDIWVRTTTASGTATHTATHTATGTATSTATKTATSTATSNEQYLPVKMTVTATTSQGQLNSTAIFTNWNAGQTVKAPPASEIAQ